jgi:hypothetical protein
MNAAVKCQRLTEKRLVILTFLDDSASAEALGTAAIVSFDWRVCSRYCSDAEERSDKNPPDQITTCTKFKRITFGKTKRISFVIIHELSIINGLLSSVSVTISGVFSST